MEFSLVTIEKPETVNVILGQSHFIKTVEDIYEAVVQTSPHMRFGLGFCESSGPALLRFVGNDAPMIELARKNGMALSCGHCFVLFLENGFPVSILNAIKNLPEVCHIYCATANPIEVVIAETKQGRGIMGVIDGVKTKGIETDQDIVKRKEFLRAIGYKL